MVQAFLRALSPFLATSSASPQPVPGQAEYLKACWNFCGTGDHAVGYSGIYWVEEKPQWIHVGGNTTNHGGNSFNHWMASYPAWQLWYTAVEFLARHASQGKLL